MPKRSMAPPFNRAQNRLNEACERFKQCNVLHSAHVKRVSHFRGWARLVGRAAPKERAATDENQRDDGGLVFMLSSPNPQAPAVVERIRRAV